MKLILQTSNELFLRQYFFHVVSAGFFKLPTRIAQLLTETIYLSEHGVLRCIHLRSFTGSSDALHDIGKSDFLLVYGCLQGTITQYFFTIWNRIVLSGK